MKVTILLYNILKKIKIPSSEPIKWIKNAYHAK